MTATNSAQAAVHAKIAEDAARLRASKHVQMRPLKSDMPELQALLKDSRTVIERALPKTVLHLGQPYYLRCTVACLIVEIFDSSVSEEPILVAPFGSSNTFGHTPIFSKPNADQ